MPPNEIKGGTEKPRAIAFVQVFRLDKFSLYPLDNCAQTPKVLYGLFTLSLPSPYHSTRFKTAPRFSTPNFYQLASSSKLAWNPPHIIMHSPLPSAYPVLSLPLGPLGAWHRASTFASSFSPYRAQLAGWEALPLPLSTFCVDGKASWRSGSLPGLGRRCCYLPLLSCPLGGQAMVMASTDGAAMTTRLEPSLLGVAVRAVGGSATLSALRSVPRKLWVVRLWEVLSGTTERTNKPRGPGAMGSDCSNVW